MRNIKQITFVFGRFVLMYFFMSILGWHMLYRGSVSVCVSVVVFSFQWIILVSYTV